LGMTNNNCGDKNDIEMFEFVFIIQFLGNLRCLFTKR
jgi:hypothetical protein